MATVDLVNSATVTWAKAAGEATARAEALSDGASTVAAADVVKRDGSVPLTGALDAGGFRVVNSATPTNVGDLTTKAYVDGFAGGGGVVDQTLREWAEAGAYEATAVTLDSDQVVTTATLKWPDGSAGTYTTTAKDATWLAVNSYTASHTASGKTVTQAAVTRDSDGNVTTKPALSVA